MGELEVKHLVNDLKWAITLSGVEGRDVGTALARVLYEQPCGVDGAFGMEGNLKRYVCNKLWHNDIQHNYVEPELLASGCRAAVYRNRRGYSDREICARELVDGKCPEHGEVS